MYDTYLWIFNFKFCKLLEVWNKTIPSMAYRWSELITSAYVFILESENQGDDAKYIQEIPNLSSDLIGYWFQMQATFGIGGCSVI